VSTQSVSTIIANAWGNDHWPRPFKRATGDLSELQRAVSGVDLTQATAVIKAQNTLGSLLLGGAGERAFEHIYASEMQTSEVEIQDDRGGRTDADYILLNGSKRPLYRLNIKLHGTLFRSAQEQVGLAPEDCFPLATYKIGQALEKQQSGHLPYLFIVVTRSGLQAQTVGSSVPSDVIAALVAGRVLFNEKKREFEERLIQQLEATEPALIKGLDNRLEAAEWFVFSARRADILMRQMLFDRVFALRTRNFTQAFRNAEIDMHLSFSQDMMPLREFLRRTKQQSLAVVVSQIERGTI
jgi:hypothetical protein